MPDREFDSALGCKLRIPGSSHWTNEEFEAWLLYERDRNEHTRACVRLMKSLGWNPVLGHWYEGKRERHGYRCVDPVTGERHVPIEDAYEIQETRTPGFRPSRPVRPDNLPVQMSPSFVVEQLKVEPMKIPSFRLLEMHGEISEGQLRSLEESDDL